MAFFQAQQALVAATQRAYTLADARYRSGVDGYLQVLDAQRLYQATEGRGLPRAQERLDSIINSAIRQVLGSVPSTTVLSDDRTPLMNRIRDGAHSPRLETVEKLAPHIRKATRKEAP